MITLPQKELTQSALKMPLKGSIAQKIATEIYVVAAMLKI
jgi:hypothetical protein